MIGLDTNVLLVKTFQCSPPRATDIMESSSESGKRFNNLNRSPDLQEARDDFRSEVAPPRRFPSPTREYS